MEVTWNPPNVIEDVIMQAVRLFSAQNVVVTLGKNQAKALADVDDYIHTFPRNDDGLITMPSNCPYTPHKGIRFERVDDDDVLSIAPDELISGGAV